MSEVRVGMGGEVGDSALALGTAQGKRAQACLG
jgi:hypothetical protein